MTFDTPFQLGYFGNMSKSPHQKEIKVTPLKVDNINYIKGLKFEQAMKRLESTIQKLEDGDLPLEDSLKTYEEGIELVRFCEKKLAEAEGKIEILMKDKSGQKTEMEFRATTPRVMDPNEEGA